MADVLLTPGGAPVRRRRSSMTTTLPAEGWRTLWRANRPLAMLVAAMVVALVVSVAGLALDPRIVTDAPVWMKPAKFALSIGVYAATLAWLLSFLRERRPLAVSIISWATAILLAGELAIIGLQAARGTTSHFNNATPLDAALFSVMGAMIAVVWVAAVVSAFLLWRYPFADRAVGWAIRTGAVLSVIGMAVAFLMTLPTPAQRGTDTSIVGAHSVGVPDGGPALPIVGWSTSGGDLRIAHFVGMHALQVLPLVAWALARFGPDWLTAATRARLVGIAAVGYLGMLALLTWQALRGQPLVAPDAATLAAAAGLLAVVVAAAVAVITAARRTVPARTIEAG